MLLVISKWGEHRITVTWVSEYSVKAQKLRHANHNSPKILDISNLPIHGKIVNQNNFILVSVRVHISGVTKVLTLSTMRSFWQCQKLFDTLCDNRKYGPQTNKGFFQGKTFYRFKDLKVFSLKFSWLRTDIGTKY